MKTTRTRRTITPIVDVIVRSSSSSSSSSRRGGGD
jgi:hypothetical protein